MEYLKGMIALEDFLEDYTAGLTPALPEESPELAKTVEEQCWQYLLDGWELATDEQQAEIQVFWQHYQLVPVSGRADFQPLKKICRVIYNSVALGAPESLLYEGVPLEI